PGTVQQVAGTVPITLNPGNRWIYVYTDWPLPADDFFMGFAFTNNGIPGTTAAELDSLRFMLSDGPTIGSSTCHALLSGGPVGWTNSPPIESTAGGFLAQGTEFYYVPEPSTVLLSLGGLVGIAMYRRRRA